MPGFEIKINPMGAVRMTRRGKFVDDAAQRYLQYKTIISLEARKHFKEPMNGPIEVRVVFFMQPPKKLPKGRTKPTVKPDIDNMIKGIFDALNKIAWNDDAQVISVISQKHYYEEPHIRVIVEPHSA
jgi:Holliday junction resolvase RusA-like endonuclease